MSTIHEMSKRKSTEERPKINLNMDINKTNPLLLPSLSPVQI